MTQKEFAEIINCSKPTVERWERSEEVVGFWANIKPISVNDVTGYNRAVGKLFVIYGVILIALGLPLFSGQNSPFILLSVLGEIIL